MDDLKIPPFDDASRQIRLLRCLGRQETLALEVTVWDLDDLPAYHAISYTWGSPLDTATIRIDGRPFQVRRNSYYALWQARHHVLDGYLWMDSICIDQTSIEEKNQQVQMMGRIYASAKAVLACVGPHADGSEQLYQHRLMQEPRDYQLKDMVWLHKIIRKFWRRPYWSRIWIVQELDLAKKITIHCGPDLLYFRDLSLLPWRDDWADHLPSTPPHGIGLAKGRQRREGLWETVTKHISHECTDLRDHVYGVLSLYTADSSMFRSPIKVDYSISLPSLVLEVIRRQRCVRNTFASQFIKLLQELGLASGDGLSTLKTFRETLTQNNHWATKIEDHLLSACWYDSPMTQELPHFIQHLAMGCKVATFDADAEGHLSVRPWHSYRDLRPWDRRAVGPKKFFAPCVEPVTEVSFDIAIKNIAYTLTVRVTSTARPHDLLLRTGQQIYGDPDNRSLKELSPASRLGGVPSINLEYDRLKDRSPEEFVVVRWIGPDVWKVIGQAHVTACLPRHVDSPAAQEDLCFNDEVRKFGLVYSLMNAEAKFLQWTHCLAAPYTDDRDTRTRKLDRLASLSPPPSYFYFVPCIGGTLETCRTDLAPDWENRYCRHLSSSDSQQRPEHLWSSDHASNFLGGQLYGMYTAEILQRWLDDGMPLKSWPY